MREKQAHGKHRQEPLFLRDAGEEIMSMESFFQHALATCERQLGGGHPDTTTIALNYVDYLLQQEEKEEAIKVLVRFPSLRRRFVRVGEGQGVM